jgi:hypothetical protein
LFGYPATRVRPLKPFQNDPPMAANNANNKSKVFMSIEGFALGFAVDILLDFHPQLLHLIERVAIR